MSGCFGSLPSVRAATPAATTHIALARGVTYWRDTFQNSSGATVRAVLLRIDLTVTRLHIEPASAGELIDGPLHVMSRLAGDTHALAGINADFYHSDGTPYGGMIRNGRVLKSPHHRRNANFYIRRNGTAAIGPVAFGGSVRRAAAGSRPAASAPIRSVNAVREASWGGITLITPRLARIALDSGCTAAVGRTAHGVQTVTGVKVGVRHLARRTAGHWALAGCNTQSRWIRDHLRSGDQVTITTGFPHGKPRALVAGGGVLVKAGALYTDRRSVHVPGLNPETFACVSRTGTSVLFGVIDGRSSRSAGVTFGELAHYMLRLRCYTGMVFDGGGSTEMVARLPGHRSVSVLNVPSDGNQRPIPNGLFVYRR